MSAVLEETRQQRRARRKRQRQLRQLLLIACAVVLVLLVYWLVEQNTYRLTMELQGEDTIVTEYGHPFNDPGATAQISGGLLFRRQEEVPVSVTANVNVNSLSVQTVTYTAEYRVGLRVYRKSCSRTVEVADREAPVILLTNSEKGAIYPGAPYVEEGFLAADNFDGDVTTQVQRQRQGDTVVYTVTDSHGNTAQAVRELTYLEELPEDAKVIYLTFDDGPGKYTEELLQILEKYDVRVTFFVCNGEYNHLLTDIAAKGHAIGVHAYNHRFESVYASESAYFKDFNKMQDLIQQYTGSKTKLLRFPGGSSNTASRYNPGIMSLLVKRVKQKGYYYFDWSVDSNDAGGAESSQEIYENVINGVKGKSSSVVLQHDTAGKSVRAVEMILQWGLENGYIFLPLTEDSPTCHHGVNN